MQAKDSFASGEQLIASDYAQAISEFEKSRDLFARLGDDCEAAIAENWAAQFLPDVAKVAESRQRLSAMIEIASSRRYNVLLASAYYWLAVSDYRRSGLSETNKNLKIALRLAEDGHNAFEIEHAQETLAEYYSEIGELEPALAYASKMLPAKDLYYQSPSQSWRNKGTLADLSLKLKFFSTSLSLSREALSIAREISPNGSRVNENLLNMVNAMVAKKDFDDALTYANESKQIALSRGESAENTRTVAEIHLLLADIKSQTKDCSEALTDYDKALELYRRLPELTVRLYQIHKGSPTGKGRHPLTKIYIGNGLFYTHKLDTELCFEKVETDASGKAKQREVFGNVAETIGVKIEGDEVDFTIRINDREETQSLKRVDGLPFRIEIKNMDYNENAVYSDMADYYGYLSSPNGNCFDLVPIVEDAGGETVRVDSVNLKQFCHPVASDLPSIDEL